MRSPVRKDTNKLKADMKPANKLVRLLLDVATAMSTTNTGMLAMEDSFQAQGPRMAGKSISSDQAK